jgi:hypothetical protein
LNTILENVATPFTAFTVADTPAGDDVTVTEAVELGISVPVESCTCTTTAESVAPTTLLTGAVVNVSRGAETLVIWLILAATDPPPVTVTALVTCAAAFGATYTVTVIGG